MSSSLVFTLFSGVLSLAYAWLLSWYSRAWRSISNANTPKNFIPQKRITILIPARNEAAKIGACLQSILAGQYPSNLLEIIVLDDFSTDRTLEVARAFLPDFSVIRLAEHLPAEARFTANKKKALELGVNMAKGELIVSTDADCLAPPNWLWHLASAFENPTIQMVCAPVMFHDEKNGLQRFQSLDFLGLMGITGAGYHLGWHQMANGANLAYRKTAFETVGGYAGNTHLASGDDMFLVQKIARKWPGSVQFFKNLEATVRTQAAPDFGAFWQQRLRWGTKNAALPDWPLRLSLLTVFLFCWSIWLNLGLFLWNAAEFASNGWIFWIQILVKALFDYLFLSEMCRFFERKDLMRWFWPSFLMHTAYIAVLGTASLFLKKYTWKARKSA